MSIENGVDNFSMTIDWGDGNITNYFGDVSYYITHTYTTSGIYTAKMTFDNSSLIKKFYIYGGFLTDILGINILTTLVELWLNSKLTYFNPTHPLPNSLEVLNLNGNLLTSFNPTYPLPNSLKLLNLGLNQSITSFDSNLIYNLTSLEDLSLQGCPILVFNPTFSLPNTLLYLNLISCGLTSLDVEIPNSVTDLQLSDNSFSTSEINNIFVYLSGLSSSNLTYLSINNQTGGGCLNNPSSGYTAYQNFIGLGWTVYVDICP
jgi:hypothetical protein